MCIHVDLYGIFFKRDRSHRGRMTNRRVILLSDVRESIERARDPGDRRRVSCGGIGERTSGRLPSIQLESTGHERAEILRQEAL